jgi:hypothetical protein
MIWQVLGWLMIALFFGGVFLLVAPDMKEQWLPVLGIMVLFLLIIAFIITAAILASGEWP